MKKVFIAFMSLALAASISSCKKDGGNPTTNDTVDPIGGAQWGQGTSDSLPNTNASLDTVMQPGGSPFSPSPAQLPCIVPGQPYDVAITFRVPQHVYGTPVGDVFVDSLHFVSICNLPQGLKWKVNRASAKYGKGEYGVLEIYGTTSATAGQYNINMWVQAFLNGQHSWEATQNSTAAGLSYAVRVADGNGNCSAYDANNPNAIIPNCLAGE